jgi:Uma2 family endonuclease
MSARTLLTFEQFEQLHDDGLEYQLLEGELLVLPPHKPRHTRVQTKPFRCSEPLVKKHQLGEVYSEAGFKLSSST